MRHPVIPPRKSEQCRRNARYCGLLAAAAASEADRRTLLVMQRSWLALADNEEWLEGMRRGTAPAHRVDRLRSAFRERSAPLSA